MVSAPASPVNTRGKRFSILPAFAVFAAVLILVLSAGAHVGTLLLRGEYQRRAHRMSVDLLPKHMELNLTRRLKVIQALAEDPLVVGILTGADRPDNPRVRLALNTANKVARSELILILDREGTVRSSSNFKDGTLTGYNYVFRPYFQNSMAGRTYVFPALGAVTNTRGVYLSSPVYDFGGTDPIGVIALKIGIAEIISLLEEGGDKVAVVSPEGVIFSSNQPEWLFHTLKPIPAETLSRLRRTRQFGGIPFPPFPWDLTHGTVTMGGGRYYVERAPLPIEGWEVVSCQEKNSLIPLPSLHKYLMVTVFSVTGGLALLVFFLLASIHRRRHTEEMLRRAEEKYHGIFVNATMGIFQSTLDGRIIEASPSHAHMLGYDSPEALMEAITDIPGQIYLVPEDRGEYLRLLFQHRVVEGFETQFVRRDGTTIWVSLSGRVVVSPGGQTAFVEGFSADITERKLAEEALRRERDIVSRVTETSPVGITLMDNDGDITFANSRAEQILRIEKDPSGGHAYLVPDWRITDLEGNPFPAENVPVNVAVRTGTQVRDVRYAMEWPDGRRVLLSVNCAPLFDEGGDVAGIVSTMEDISDKVRAEKEARARRQQLVQADRMISLGILTSGVAHEINNPNTFIMSNAELFSDAWKEVQLILEEYYGQNGDFLIGGLPYSEFRDRAPRLCSHILEGSKRIKTIVKELRDYSRSDSGGLTETVNVNEVIQSARILLANMIRKSTHRFVVEVDEGVPAIKGNFQRLEQVVINMVQNACQALPGPDRGIYVSTSREPESRSILITCRDEGIGIPREDLGHVTDPFFTTKRSQGGTGLGLSISSAIVREHHGTMEVLSSPGEGTVVTIRFPAEAPGGI